MATSPYEDDNHYSQAFDEATADEKVTSPASIKSAPAAAADDDDTVKPLDAGSAEPDAVQKAAASAQLDSDNEYQDAWAKDHPSEGASDSRAEDKPEAPPVKASTQATQPTAAEAPKTFGQAFKEARAAAKAAGNADAGSFEWKGGKYGTKLKAAAPSTPAKAATSGAAAGSTQAQNAAPSQSHNQTGHSGTAPAKPAAQSTPVKEASAPTSRAPDAKPAQADQPASKPASDGKLRYQSLQEREQENAAARGGKGFYETYASTPSVKRTDPELVATSGSSSREHFANQKGQSSFMGSTPTPHKGRGQ